MSRGVLTTILFTTIFTLGSGLMDTVHDQNIRKAGGEGQAVLNYISDEVYNDVAGSPLIDRIAYAKAISYWLKNPGLERWRSDLWYMDDTALEFAGYTPTTGRLPESENEIIADTKTLEALGVLARIGETVSLTYEVKGKTYTTDFALCGFWETDSLSNEEAIPEPKLPEEGEIAAWIPAEIGLAYRNRLFYIERGLKELTAEERALKRREQEIPVWEGFWKWVVTVNAAGGSKLSKAVTYALNHRETLTNYLVDGRCEISNNAAERKAKSYAIGRKASLFHASEAEASASAVIYSIVETAKANGLNVFQYLYLVLLYMPCYPNDPAGIEQLLPWSDFIKKHCSGLIDIETMTPEVHEPLPI